MAVLAMILGVSACGLGPHGPDRAGGAPPERPPPALEVGVPDPTLAPAGAAPSCDPTRNLTPGTLPSAGAMPAKSTMRDIQKRGHVVVGVDQNTRMFAAPDSDTRVLEGFDIDLAREVARAIFGDPNRVRLRTIPPGRRLEVLENHEVDMVVHAMTITCQRWQRVDFSSGYFADSLRLLVPRASTAKTLNDLAGQYVCVSADTTPERLIAASKARVYQVADRNDCLVALQEGRVAAVYTNSALLESLREQDPTLKIAGSAADRREISAIAVPKGESDFVRFLNGTIERIIDDGTWRQMYDRWFPADLGNEIPPTTTYRG